MTPIKPEERKSTEQIAVEVGIQIINEVYRINPKLKTHVPGALGQVQIQTGFIKDALDAERSIIEQKDREIAEVLWALFKLDDKPHQSWYIFLKMAEKADCPDSIASCKKMLELCLTPDKIADLRSQITDLNKIIEENHQKLSMYESTMKEKESELAKFRGGNVWFLKKRCEELEAQNTELIDRLKKLREETKDNWVKAVIDVALEQPLSASFIRRQEAVESLIEAAKEESGSHCPDCEHSHPTNTPLISAALKNLEADNE